MKFARSTKIITTLGIALCAVAAYTATTPGLHKVFDIYTTSPDLRREDVSRGFDQLAKGFSNVDLTLGRSQYYTDGAEALWKLDLTTGRIQTRAAGTDSFADQTVGAGSLPLASVPAGIMRQTTAASITDAANSIGSGTTTVNVSTADFADPGTNVIVHGVRVRTTTPFSGNAISSALLDVGIAGSLDYIVTDYDLLAAAGATNLIANNALNSAGMFIQPTTAAYNVVFTITTDQNPTAGAVEYIIFYTTLQ